MPLLAWKNKSFDELPALAVRGEPLRRALRRVTLAWMFGIVWGSAIGGSQFTDFCWLLGFQDRHFGYMSAIFNAAIFLQVFAALYVERTGVRKWFFIYLCLASRLIWIPIGLLPLFLKPEQLRAGGVGVLAFLCLYSFSWVLSQLSGPAWMQWMGDLIPRRVRGRYFGVRRLWTIPVSLVVVMGIAWLLDLVTVGQAGESVITFHSQPVLAYTLCIFIAASGIFGSIDILLFLTLREIATKPLAEEQPADTRTIGRKVLDTLIDPFRVLVEAFGNKTFRHYALYCATLSFGAQISGNYFVNNALRDVHLSKFATNLVFMVLGPMSGMFIGVPLGRLLDRYGRRPVLILGTLVTVFSTGGWFFMTPTTPGVTNGAMVLAWILGGATCMLGGVGWAAVELGQTATTLGFTESKGRSKFMAAAAVVSAVGGVLGGLAGAGVADHFQYLQSRPWMVGPFQYNNYHITFFLSTVFRALSIVWLLGMPETTAVSLREVLRAVSFGVYRRLTFRLSRPLSLLEQRMLDSSDRRRKGPP